MAISLKEDAVRLLFKKKKTDTYYATFTTNETFKSLSEQAFLFNSLGWREYANHCELGQQNDSKAKNLLTNQMNNVLLVLSMQEEFQTHCWSYENIKKFQSRDFRSTYLDRTVRTKGAVLEKLREQWELNDKHAQLREASWIPRVTNVNAQSTAITFKIDSKPELGRYWSVLWKVFGDDGGDTRIQHKKPTRMGAKTEKVRVNEIWRLDLAKVERTRNSKLFGANSDTISNMSSLSAGSGYSTKSIKAVTKLMNQYRKVDQKDVPGKLHEDIAWKVANLMK